MEKSINRRELLGTLCQGAGVALCSGLGLAALARGSSEGGWSPRPPGAAEEFASLCLKCGLCVRACPKGTLKLARLGDPAPLGTPFFTPREVACYMCEDIPCVAVCPSGALDRNLKDIRKARMGIAAIDPHSCLSYQGLRCEVCFRDCPVRGKALTLDPHSREISKHAVFVPTIHPEHCTGCGLCTWSCPTEKPAINIVPRERFLGEIGRHYRLGWKSDEEQPHHPKAPTTKDVPMKDKDLEKTAPGGLDYLNSMDDPTL